MDLEFLVSLDHDLSLWHLLHILEKNSSYAQLWPFPKSDKLRDIGNQKALRAAFEEEISSTDTRVLEDCPNGLPRLAAFLSSEGNFTTFRGFSYLHARVLLDKQQELADLERQLDDLDKIDDTEETGDGQRRLTNRGFDRRKSRIDEERPRKEILSDIHRVLLEYDELLLKARDTLALQKPSQRDYRSVRTWIFNNKPLVAAQSSFIKKKEDIITLRSGREWSDFDGLVETCLKKVDFFNWNKVRTNASLEVTKLMMMHRNSSVRQNSKQKHEINTYFTIVPPALKHSSEPSSPFWSWP
jgi:uncharacterized protein DUF6594